MAAFIIFKACIENKKGTKIKTVRSDNRNEFINAQLHLFFSYEGIRHQTTISYCPEQNGAAGKTNVG